MGRNTTTPDPSSLDRFSIGEIRDLSGVAEFYDAGTSKWLKSATPTPSSNLSASSKANLASAATSTSPTVIMQGSLARSYIASGTFAPNPIARISASGVSVVPSCYTQTTAVGVGVATSVGFQIVATGQTSFRTNSVSGGTNGVVASDNTTIFSYCFTSATALSASYTTNGTTWTAGTVTGIPTFSTSSTTTNAWCSQTGTTYTLGGQNGWRRNGTNTQWTVVWCGARFLLLGPGGTNFVASLSTDGLAWGGDNTLAVLGTTTRAQTSNFQFYRNGNNCYLHVGTTTKRYSTDGGITWAASSGPSSLDPTDYFMQYNQTDPAKLIQLTVSSTAAYYSADSGATWSADRPLPFSTMGGVAYKGNTVVCSNSSNSIQVSTDNGATWTPATLPIGVLSKSSVVYADAYRFYATVLNQKQILTSADGLTWTIASVPVEVVISHEAWAYGVSLATFDSNTAVLYGTSLAGGRSYSTTDGGVTWTASQFVIASNPEPFAGGNTYVTPDAGGMTFCLSGTGFLTNATNPVLFKSDVTAGGAFYQTGTTAITPIQTGATAYVRVG
jgi:hypothetical protein